MKSTKKLLQIYATQVWEWYKKKKNKTEKNTMQKNQKQQQ